MAAAALEPDLKFQALVRAKHAGDPQAIAALGARLLVGREAPFAPVDGAALIEEAARQGDGAAWRRVAVLAAAGVGRTQSWSDALDALARACDLGDALAHAETELVRGIGVSDTGSLHAWLAAPVARELGASPRMFACREFLAPSLCAHLIARAAPKLVPAQVNDARGGGLKLDPMRTNTGAVFSLLESDLAIELVRARIARTASVAAAALEPAEVLHYCVGERYKLHVDFFHPALPTFAEEMRLKGQRVKTCLVYLNDDFDGGETEFPKLDIKFRGELGEALFFDNVATSGTGDMKTLHQGLPPISGEKWLFSQWIRSKPQQPA
jgi:prolyl 4-hydroxylase